MVTVQADVDKNVFRIVFSAHVDKAQVQQSLAEIEASSRNLQPGFRLLTDLSGLVEMDHSCAPEIQKSMDMFRKKGVAQVIRIIPDPAKDIGFKLMSAFHYGREIPIITCETAEEAEEKLG